MDRDIVRWPAFTRRGWIVKCSRNSGVFSFEFRAWCSNEKYAAKEEFQVVARVCFPCARCARVVLESEKADYGDFGRINKHTSSDY